MHPLLIALCFALGLAALSGLISVLIGLLEDPMRRATPEHQLQMKELLADPSLPKKLKVGFDPGGSAIPRPNWTASRLDVGDGFFQLERCDQLNLLRWTSMYRKMISFDTIALAYALVLILLYAFVESLHLILRQNYPAILVFLPAGLAVFSTFVHRWVENQLKCLCYRKRLEIMGFEVVQIAMARAFQLSKGTGGEHVTGLNYEEWKRISERLGYDPLAKRRRVSASKRQGDRT